jgi:hypothetical protein
MMLLKMKLRLDDICYIKILEKGGYHVEQIMELRR